jgi:ankyrin repeat protein
LFFGLCFLGAPYIDAGDADGFTPLVHAVIRDHKPSVELLAKRGANLESKAQGGFTPLAVAIVESKLAAAMALIAAGAPVGTPSGEAGLTPLMLAAGKEPVELSLGAGRHLIEKPDPHYPGTLEVARALIERGADVNALSGTGVTALMLAAAHNIAPMVGLLVQSGADVARKSADGKTALEIAQENGNHTVVSTLRLLEQSGSN